MAATISSVVDVIMDNGNSDDEDEDEIDSVADLEPMVSDGEHRDVSPIIVATVPVEDVILVESDDDDHEDDQEYHVAENTNVNEGQIVNDFFRQTNMRAAPGLRFPWLTLKCLTIGSLLILFVLLVVFAFVAVKTFSASKGVQTMSSIYPTLAPSARNHESSSAPHSSDVAWDEVVFDVMIPGGKEYECCAVALSGNGETLFVAGVGFIRTYDLKINGGVGVWSQSEDIPLRFDKPPLLSVSSDGSHIVVSYPMYRQNAGGAIVFRKRVGHGWQRVGGECVGESQGDYFGISVAITGNGRTVVLGACNASYVEVYAMGNDEMWNRQLRLACDTAPCVSFGRAVAISSDGSWLLVSAPSNKRGTVYLYKLLSSRILFQKIDGALQEKMFGSSIGISSDGSKIAISVRSNNTLACVKVYKFDSTINQYIQVGVTSKSLTSYISCTTCASEKVAISPDGSTVAAGVPWTEVEGEGTAKLYLFSVKENEIEIIDEKIIKTTFPAIGIFVDLSQTGKFVATGTTGREDNKVKIYSSFE